MKLIGNFTSPFVRKVRIVAAEKRIEYEWELMSPWAPTSRVAEFNPLGQIPALILDDGTALFDSRVICEFLDNVSPIAKMLPQGNRERIEVKCWEALADGIMEGGILARLEGKRPQKSEQSAEWIERQMAKVQRGLDAMEADLTKATGPWCCGTAFTLADVAIAACTGFLDFRYPDLDWRSERPQLTRLTERLAERPSVAETVPHE